MSDRDELFRDDSFDEEPFGDEDFWPEEEEEAGEGDLRSELGDESRDVPEFGEELEEEEGRRPTILGLNRTFVIIGAIIALIVCLGIGALLIYIQATAGPTDIELTVTAVYATNTFVAYALELTETQNAVNAYLTATADAWTDTPTPTPTFTATPSPSPTVELATQVPIFMTPTPDLSAGGLSASAIELTATALAAILRGGTPTPEGGVSVPGFVTVTPGPLATALPSTGLFDDAIAGGQGINGLLTAALAALGLGAVIVVVRRLRAQ
ncbi:MAG: hypothetical protein HPY64_10925 [Anaerolineae bacterium]|nr:hypothetical protein [Anaerolineae bacterium]